jgi:arylsulfatase A-like enzyme
MLVKGLVLAVILAGCGRDDFRGANVVVVGIDTLRADHVGAYGYPRPTTPRIDAFSRDAIRFETAVSQSPWTLPAFASMFTGRVPSAHGAGEGACPSVTTLGDAHESLATVLRKAGYETASFVSNAWVGTDVGMARGFDRHRQCLTSGDVLNRTEEWLAEPRRPPFFLFVHIVDPHQPWMPTPEDAALFVDPAYEGAIGTQFWGAPKPEWTAADRRRIVDLYDAEVRWADGLTGRLLDALEERGFAANTIVVVTSDHGEELFERGTLGHGHTLYDEVLLVPFLIRFPGGRSRGPIATPVRTMDLFPTVLEALGQPVPAGLDGVSLMPLIRGGDPAPRSAVSEYVCFAADPTVQSLRTPREKLVVHPVTGQTELFDLVADPRETTDVAPRQQVTVAALRAQLADAVPVPPGFHLLVQGGNKDGVLRARFEAGTRFQDVRLDRGEPADRFRVTRDGTRLDLKLRLTTRQRPAPATDVDALVFRTEQDGPVVLRRIAMNATPMSLAQLSFGDGQGPTPNVHLPLSLSVDMPGLVVGRPVPPPLRLDLQPRARLAFVRRPAAPQAVITPELAERLRALGYMR